MLRLSFVFAVVMTMGCGTAAAAAAPDIVAEQPPRFDGFDPLIQRRGIVPGEIDAGTALRAMFGPFEFSRGALWHPGAAVAAVGGDYAGADENTPFRVHAVLTASLVQGGVPRYLVVTAARWDEAHCPDCRPLIGVARFIKEERGWRLEIHNRLVALGARDAHYELVALGADRHGVAVRATATRQGLTTQAYGVLAEVDGRFRTVLSVAASDQSNDAACHDGPKPAACWAYASTYAVQPAAEGAWPAIKRVSAGTHGEASGKIRPVKQEQTYRFVDGGYR